MTRHLFVGGANDGTYHAVEPDIQHFRLRVAPEDPPPYNLLDPIVFDGAGETIEGYRQGLPADPGEQYETGFKNGYRYGVLSAVKAIEADNPQGNAPMWNVFRDRCYGLIKALLK